MIPFDLAGLEYLEYRAYQRYLVLPVLQVYQGVQEPPLTLVNQRPLEVLPVP